MKYPTSAIGAALIVPVLAFASNAYGSDLLLAMSVRNEGPVSYISGGIGEDEKELMRPMAKQYNLRMAFATTAGEYLADIKVTVHDSKGKVVLDTLSEAPCLLAAVPAGTYKITAEREGKKIVKTANLAARRGAALYFYWPEPRESVVERRSELREQAVGDSQQHGCF
jgi:hypothetical protein